MLCIRYALYARSCISNTLHSICVPAGDFIQTAVLGASLGRLAGETLKLWFKHVDPAVYALIGSAAFSGGATQSISGRACSHCSTYTYLYIA
jgi:H+/Cl- antiporter ClcA